MAITLTVDGRENTGNNFKVRGTFTSATGDTQVVIAVGTTGINHIVDANVSLDAGGIDTPRPKKTISGGTLTADFEDTLGYSGTWYVEGR